LQKKDTEYILGNGDRGQRKGGQERNSFVLNSIYIIFDVAREYFVLNSIPENMYDFIRLFFYVFVFSFSKLVFLKIVLDGFCFEILKGNVPDVGPLFDSRIIRLVC